MLSHLSASALFVLPSISALSLSLSLQLSLTLLLLGLGQWWKGLRLGENLDRVRLRVDEKGQCFAGNDGVSWS
jgi:hypothetical protein